jgi:hypothetical protein
MLLNNTTAHGYNNINWPVGSRPGVVCSSAVNGIGGGRLYNERNATKPWPGNIVVTCIYCSVTIRDYSAHISGSLLGVLEFSGLYMSFEVSTYERVLSVGGPRTFPEVPGCFGK